MQKILVDTNILLRIILRDDKAGFKEAEAFLLSQANSICRVTPLVVSEVLYVLHVLGYNRENCADSLLALIQHKQFYLDEYILRSIQMFKLHKLDFVDCYLVLVAVGEGQGLKTLDRKAKKLYEKLKLDQREQA